MKRKETQKSDVILGIKKPRFWGVANARDLVINVDGDVSTEGFHEEKMDERGILGWSLIHYVVYEDLQGRMG